MRFSCGIIDATPAWAQLLEQEGVPWVRIGREIPDPASMPVVIVDRHLIGSEERALRAYLAGGGAILGAARHCARLTGIPFRAHRVRFLTDPREEGESWVDLLDADTVCQIPREANILKTDEGFAAAFAGEWRGGAAVILPFDVREIWSRTAARCRRFPAPSGRLPWERVSAAGRGELLRLVHCALEFLHHVRGKPYPRLSPFPEGAGNLLAYRLDTDRATEAQVEAFRSLSEEAAVPFSWFVDTGSHLGWLERFARMPGQDVGVHCRVHRGHDTPGGYAADILQARRLLEEAGVRVEGYAAPFGAWNTALADALESLGMPWSSEFGIGYDTFPFRPEAAGRQYPTLQVPVHPVSSGALRRAGHDRERMKRYFAGVIERKVARCEPLFFYDHPLHGNRELGLAVLRQALLTGARPVTLAGYARWWTRRSALLRLLGSCWPDDVSAPARVAAASDGIVARVTLGLAVAECPLTEGPLPAPVSPRAPYRAPGGAGEAREFDLRTAAGSALTSFLRWRQR